MAGWGACVAQLPNLGGLFWTTPPTAQRAPGQCTGNTSDTADIRAQLPS